MKSTDSINNKSENICDVVTCLYKGKKMLKTPESTKTLQENQGLTMKKT